RAAGVLDFDDLIRNTARLLETPGMGDWVRYKLDRATDHILVDEAQDTNASQWAIIASLAAEYFAGEGARGAVIRTLFTVGDFKQAIFGFQGTDPQAFLAAGLSFTRQAKAAGRTMHRLSLDRSFRSSPPVLAVVDGLIAELGVDRLGLDEAVNRHVSARDRLRGQVTLWRPIAAGHGADDDEDAEEGWIDDATRAFATRLAHQIRIWLDDPFPVAGKGRPLRPEDIMILVRRRGDLASLLVARLHEEGVPVAGVDRLRLTAPLAVRDLLAAIRFVLQPDDDLSLASLLVSPLFGLSQDALYAVGFGRSGSLWAALRRAPGHEETVAGLGLLLARADFTTPYQFLEAMLTGPLDGRRKLLARLGEEARDPIEELLNAALQFEAAETPSLQRFLDWFDRGDVDITRDASAPLDAVRVMTVHGAKGLQAPVVILADATGDPDHSRVSALDWEVEEGLRVPVFRPRKEELAGTLADDLAAVEQRERAEHWRLLYVAATRAEERLYIGGALGVRARGEPAEDSWYQVLDRALAALGAEWEDDALWSGARHYRGSEAAATGVARGDKAAVALPPPVLPDWLFRAAPREARPSRPLAPSALGVDRVADPPPSPAMLDAARRGRLLHALFERLPAVAPNAREAAAVRWLQHAAGVETESARVELVSAACAIIADPRFAAIFGADALAEAPIAAVVGEQVIAGTVDRLLVTDTVVRVVDFKTGRRVPATVEAVPEHHIRQMAAYAAALEVVFPGRRVEAALLYTAGPRLVPLPEALLARCKADLARTEEKLPLAR
ncbi:MAG TPA: UvrD-helicase domain-containing protein, partial [Sphingomonadaceae bacterium]|nr:UvrD-helicase domain-containing protein [Sphingomonadaceae bacterium]